MKSPFAKLAHYPATSLKIMLGKSAFLHHEIRIHIGGIVVHMDDNCRCQPVGHYRTALSAAFQRSLARMVVSVEMQFSIIVNASQPVLLVPNHRTEALGFLVVERVAVAIILVSSGFRFAHLHDFTRGMWVGRVVVTVVQRIALLHPATTTAVGYPLPSLTQPPLRSCFYFNELLFFYISPFTINQKFYSLYINRLIRKTYYSNICIFVNYPIKCLVKNCQTYKIISFYILSIT